MRDQQDAYQWSHVDQTGRAEHFVNYLDRVSALQAVQAYKQQTYALLDLKPGHHVLDVGCGNGDGVIALAQQVAPIGRAVGVDNSARLIAEAKKRSAGRDLLVEFLVGDVYHLDFPDAQFDGCRSDRVFQHLADCEQALAEMIRVTRPGGRVVVYDVDWEALVIDMPERTVTRKIVNYFCDTSRNGWAGRTLPRLFKVAGLADIAVVPTTGIIPDYPLVSQLLSFKDTMEALVARGDLSTEEATRWFEDAEQAHQQGHFFSAVTGFAVGGRKR